ncbi:MAG: group II intron reverse transcriptase/maturase [Candidatus Izemoplasmatales bacterium]|nr:group II intron reverse transcriptase/maturase [Candidatus Izemoplasmatales bacterium]
MKLIEVITTRENLNKAYKKVIANKGASGIDGTTVEELGDYIKSNKDDIVSSIRNRKYFPKPVRRVYIPKSNGKMRPLGIPTALDRTIQQAIAQPITDIYEEIFSENSYGFRPNRSCHDAIKQALNYLNDGYEWVIDIDIEQFFDKVNHDKLIQILREQVNDSATLNLIRKYLKAGVMEQGLVKATETGLPQGGPLSVVLSNIYLDKLDKELEQRGHSFVRYADDVMIFTKSEKAANRVMNSISDWILRKLFLKVNATKSKVDRPTRSKYLGFTFLKYGGQWKVKPTTEKKKALYEKMNEYLKRGKAISRSLVVTIKRVNKMVIGWINYFRIGMMKGFMEKFGAWLRHKIRVILMKQWKIPKTIYRNLTYLNRKYNNGFNHEAIFKVANSRLGWYKRCGMNVVNFILSPKLLETKVKDGAYLLNPLKYYLRSVGI